MSFGAIKVIKDVAEHRCERACYIKVEDHLKNDS